MSECCDLCGRLLLPLEHLQGRCEYCDYAERRKKARERMVCGGDVGVVDEHWYGDNSYWVHACDGHGNWTGIYQPPPPDCVTALVDDLLEEVELLTTVQQWEE